MLSNCIEEVYISGKRHIPLDSLLSPYLHISPLTHSQTRTKQLVQYIEALPIKLGSPKRVGQTNHRFCSFFFFGCAGHRRLCFPRKTQQKREDLNSTHDTNHNPFTHHERTASHPASAPETTIRPDTRFNGVLRTPNTGRVNRPRVPEPASRRIELNERESHRISDEPDLINAIRDLLAHGV